MTTEEMLKNDTRLAQGITDLATTLEEGMRILALAILESNDHEGSYLKPATKRALQILADVPQVKK